MGGGGGGGHLNAEKKITVIVPYKQMGFGLK